MASYTALFDANVLASIRLADIGIRLASTGLFRIQWSEDIHEEWMRSVAEMHQHITPEQMQRRREHMDLAMPDAIVTGYRSLIVGEPLPDKDDRHVLAAAIVGRADVIVTFNLRDFPAEDLEPFGLEAQHPDVFFDFQRTLNPDLFQAVVKQARAALIKPEISADEYLDSLRRQGLQVVAGELQKVKGLL